MFRSLSSAVGLERLDLGPERFDLAAIRRTAALVRGALILAAHHHEHHQSHRDWTGQQREGIEDRFHRKLQLQSIRRQTAADYDLRTYIVDEQPKLGAYVTSRPDPP